MPLVRRHGVELRPATANAGIGEAGIHAPEALQRLGEGRHHLVFVRHVAAQRFHVGAVLDRRLQFGLGGRVLFLVGAPKAHAGAMRGQPFGKAEADAAVAAGYQRHLPRQIEHAGLPALPLCFVPEE